MNSNNPASSYNKRKPDFRTFSPVNTPDNRKGSSGSLDSDSLHPLIDGGRSHYSGHSTLPIRAQSPCTDRIHGTLPHPRVKLQGRTAHRTLPNREDHTANSYQPGFDVDPDGLNYTINEFMLSNCKEDVV